PWAAAHGASAEPGSRAEYVDLFAFINPEEDRVLATRFFVEEKQPTGDEDRDFAEMLAEFKAKVAAHVGENDSGSHYDLGLAFKEMGLIDEAIGEFQVALRAGANRLKVFEELGQCFILKRQPTIAVKILARALQIEHDDELEMIGVYYHLGRAHEELDQFAEARDAYERVLGLDIGFKDVMDRVSRL
ncbi:MAG: tetratricopeptide repeat protein, partial [Longimicrobiales bacterium]